MAHRADVIQVHRDFDPIKSNEIVTDPFCGKQINNTEARSILFRENETLYFCSRKCREDYLNRKKRHSLAA